MRIALCFRRNGQTYRLIWVSEDKGGFYIGFMGGTTKNHHSYHTDGIRHDYVDGGYHNRWADTPLAEFSGWKPLLHTSLPMTKHFFNDGSAYEFDQKTETIVMLDAALFRGRDSCAVDFLLFDQASQPEVMRRNPTYSEEFFIIAEVFVALERFPLKLAITLHSANIRSLTPEERESVPR